MRTQTTDTVRTGDGLPIHVVGWPAIPDTDVAVVIHHGLGEHADRYETFARELADAPVHLWSYDVRGHGRSGGKKGHAAGLDQLVDDLEELLPAIVERSGAQRVVLYGHSMGAAVVGRYLCRRTPHPSIAGVWLSAAPVKVDLSSFEMRIKASAAPILARIAPRLTLASGLDPNGISSVPAEVKRYVDDPLVHDRLSTRLGLSLLRDGPALIEEADRITLPIRLWHGADDPIAEPEGSREVFANLGSADKVLEIVTGARHEVHHEKPAIVASLFEALGVWLAERVPPA